MAKGQMRGNKEKKKPKQDKNKRKAPPPPRRSPHAQPGEAREPVREEVSRNRHGDLRRCPTLASTGAARRCPTPAAPLKVSNGLVVDESRKPL